MISGELSKSRNGLVDLAIRPRPGAPPFSRNRFGRTEPAEARKMTMGRNDLQAATLSEHQMLCIREG